MKQKMLSSANLRGLLLHYTMLFVFMYSMNIMYALFGTVCSYATCEWPEFYVDD